MTVTIEAIETIKNHCEHYNAPKFSESIIMLLFCFNIFCKFTFFFNNLRFLFFFSKNDCKRKKCPFLEKMTNLEKTATLQKSK